LPPPRDAALAAAATTHMPNAAKLLLLVGLAVAASEEEASEAYVVPTSVEGAHFFEPFAAESVGGLEKWTVSASEDFNGEWKIEDYGPVQGLAGDTGLVVSSEARKHAISTVFPTPIDPKGAGIVVQYELKFKKALLQCGGAYLKLLTASEELDKDGFKAETPYTIMFGPDKCGGTNKVHFILRHKSPVTGEWEEKHLASPPVPKIDKESHLYTAIVGADNSVKILIDGEEKKVASLMADGDFSPNVNPPKEVDDPEDSKPADWIDSPKMDDPEASKPDDWDEDAPAKIEDPKAEKPAAWEDDEPDTVPDPAASEPSDWDSDEDGEWEAPMIPNPKCKAAGCGEWKAPMISNPDFKGKWFAPKVDNPAYIGVWKPAQIPNPKYFLDEAPHAMAPIGGVGIELWTMQDGILFDNILISTDPAVAKSFADSSFAKRAAAEQAASKPSGLASYFNVRELRRGEGFIGTVNFYISTAWYFVLDNWKGTVPAAIILGLIPLLFLCFCTGGKAKAALVIGLSIRGVENRRKRFELRCE